MEETGAIDILYWFNNNNNYQYADNAALMLTNAFNLTAPSFLPLSSSPLLNGAEFTNSNLNGMDFVSSRGAFGTADWTSGWCN